MAGLSNAERLSGDRPRPPDLNVSRGLFEFGRQVEKELQSPGSTGLKAIAERHGVSLAEARTAYMFAKNMGTISRSGGDAGVELVLSEANPLLTPVLIEKIAKQRPGSIREMLQKAELGYHPFTTVVFDGSPARQAIWHHDLARLNTARELVAEIELCRPMKALSADGKHSVYGHAVAIKMASAAILGRLRSALSGPPQAGSPSPSIAADPAALTRTSSKARNLVEAVVHDLSLLLTKHRPTASTRNELAAVSAELHAAATRIVDATRPWRGKSRQQNSLLTDCPDGPEDRSGTYVVVMKLSAPKCLRIGRLETFALPSGYLLYVGSAFGGGGVGARTGRHRQSGSPKMWNYDHIRAIVAPVEIWWTHHAEKVECPWAMALAELPGYCCPAPRCGSNDCMSCPAHFYHRSERPSVDEFAEYVCRAHPNHATIFRMRLR